MAVAADFPFLDDPRRVVGIASYPMTAEEFRSTMRAATAILPWGRSWPWWFAFYGFWHAVLALGVWVLIACARGAIHPFAPYNNVATCSLGLAATLIAAIVLWLGLYGVPWRLRRAFRAFPEAGDAYAYLFTSDRFMFHGPTADASLGWEFVQDVFEFDDGFLFRVKPGAGVRWVPDHALAAPLDHHALAALFRSKVPKYRVVNHSAGRGPRAEEWGAAA